MDNGQVVDVGEGVVVYPIRNSQDLLNALKAVAIQGEGGANSASNRASHFRRFFDIYRAFPDDSQAPSWPTLPVAVNPNTTAEPKGASGPDEVDLAQGRITNRQTYYWAKLFDHRSRILLACILHSLSTDPATGNTISNDKRNLLTRWSFGEMTNVGNLATILNSLDRTDSVGDGKAGATFDLPYTLTLPNDERDRWRVQRDLLLGATYIYNEITDIDGAVAGLRTSDGADDTQGRRKKIAEILGTAAPPPVPPPEGATSFATDIKPLFRPIDVAHMKPFGVLLDDYAYMSVAENASLVLERLADRSMPPGGRVGNHPTEFFIGPEVPGRYDSPARFKVAPPAGSPSGTPPMLKGQAARFRVFAYDAAGNVLGELTPAEATIEWKARLVNAKAEWDMFEGRAGERLSLNERRPGKRRNDGENDRGKLIIDGGQKTVAVNQSQTFAGSFLGQLVELGEIRCGEDGRMVVLGGRGHSSTPSNSMIRHYANNDGWHDDVSDGPVNASVTLSNGIKLEAAGAWVIVAPPDFAPAITNVVTIWDVIEDVAADRALLPAPNNPSFTRDVYPILARTLDHQWVNGLAAQGHGPGGPADFSTQWSTVASSAAAEQGMRELIFSHVRDPRLLGKFVSGTASDTEQAAAKKQAKRTFMPAVSGDSGDSTPNQPDTWLTVTKRQFDILTAWKNGAFQSDWTGKPLSPPANITPAGLNRAALESCTGGAFFPGIECGWIIRNPEIFAAGESVRLDPAKVKAGDMTKRMAVPWQADFYECKQHWWPSQRPDSVISEAQFAVIVQLDQQIAQAAPGSPQRATLEQQRTNMLAERTAWWPDPWPQIPASALSLKAMKRWSTAGIGSASWFRNRRPPVLFSLTQRAHSN